MLDNNTGKPITTADILTFWHRHILNSTFPVAMEHMPEIIPFTAEDANLWLVCTGNETIGQMIMMVRRNADRRGFAFAQKLSSSNFGDNPEAQFPMLFKNIALQDKNLKVYVKYGDSEFLLNGLEFYCGVSDRELLQYRVDDNNQMFVQLPRGVEYMVTQDLVTAVFLSEPIQHDELSARVYILLMQHRDFNDELWNTAMRLHGPHPKHHIKRIMETMARYSSYAAAWLAKNWKISLAISGLVLAVAFVGSMMRTKQPKRPQILKGVTFTRTPWPYCDHGMEDVSPAMDVEL